MKIGIIGNYGHDNNGDEAILKGILTVLNERYGIEREDLVIFSNHPENTYERYGIRSEYLIHKKSNILSTIVATLQSRRQIVKELDVLIFGGGGILMDMYKRDMPLYSSLAATGKIYGCKIAIFGVGAGPIRTKIGAALIKLMIRSSSSISVRDHESCELLKKLNTQKDIPIIGDPAFYLKPKTVRMGTNEIKRIGVTAVPYFSKEYWPTPDEAKYQAYVKGMAANLDELISNNRVEVTFFSTKYPQDVKVTEDIFNEMTQKDHVNVMRENIYPEKIIELCEKQDVIIGTRLHSLILSVASSTPVIGIGYHKKVENFMKQIDREDLYIDIETLFQPDVISAKFHALKQDWEKSQKEFMQLSTLQLKKAEKGFLQLDQIIR
ncbi:polysaccharide pyruvyl transferase family protein [Peribacillus sp. JNUCC 23]